MTTICELLTLVVRGDPNYKLPDAIKNKKDRNAAAQDISVRQKATGKLISRIRNGGAYVEGEINEIKWFIGWDDGDGHPDDIASMSFALGGLRDDATDEQRAYLSHLVEVASEKILSTVAIENAQRGDWTLLQDRLNDPNKLAMAERKWVAELGPKKQGMKSKARAPELYYWFREAEGLNHASALDEICKALSNDGTIENRDAVERAINRARADGFTPSPSLRRNVEWYKSGNRSALIFPRELAPQDNDFMKFLRSRTE